MEVAVDMFPRVLMEDSAALCSDNASNYSERCSISPAEVGGVTVDVRCSRLSCYIVSGVLKRV